ncbi:MAG TPA: hypothetical protein VMW40_05805 [Candidatus Bathyarchaeia archaeon]|nr:hypothetical protein [Candidatus Bathyarchaeia archaeon]
MPKRWFVCDIYPAGRGVLSPHDELNKVRVIVEAKLRKLARPYKWFTLLMKSKRVMFGAKVEDGARIKDLIENELIKEYPDLVIGFGDEDPDNCELMAIATQCRTKLEDKIPISKWNAGQIGFIVHCMLNPYGFDNEAWTYWTSLCCIDEDVEITDRDIKDVITLVRFFLEHKKGMELEDDYEKLELLMKELDAFAEYLRKKSL